MVVPLKKPQFIIDKSGRKTAAAVAIEDYERLLEAWEDQMDFVEADEAKRTATTYITAAQLRARLR